jgi:Carboxypeptidase regulatory-like domain
MRDDRRYLAAELKDMGSPARSSMWLAVALAMATAMRGFAQDQPACNCPPPKLVPITGRVLDAVTGKPIADAVVHYFDSNPPLDGSGYRIREPIVGEVKSAADGSYALPADLPSSTFHVRASAPGYFSAGFYDWPAIVGDKWPADFPPRPSHDLRLQPSHDLVALGSSRLEVSASLNARSVDVTTLALGRDGQSIVLATTEPRLWFVSLPELDVKEIQLPQELKNDHSITQLAWDGTHLLFTAGDGSTSHVGGASAPDFHVTVLPSPDMPVTLGSLNLSDQKFTVEEVSSCDDDASPHCGQSGSLVVREVSNGKTIPIKSGSVGDLSYLLNPIVDEIVFSDSVETSTAQKVPVQVSKTGTVVVHGQKAGLTLLDLKTGWRSHIELPGDGSAELTLLAQMIVRGGLRVAYTKRGDCDPASTDAAQPFAPSGLAGDTPNAWSVCIVTVPLPASPPQPHRAAAKTHTSAQR